MCVCVLVWDADLVRRSAVAVNDSLEVLSLESNKISNEGASALADALRTNTRLVELNLLGQPHQFGTLSSISSLLRFIVILIVDCDSDC